MVAGVHNQQNDRDRACAACQAALSIAVATKTEAVLQRIVDLAREVVPARYAALWVRDETGRDTHFVTSGLTPEERAGLGAKPAGLGLLGTLITERTPLLVPDIAADPRSVGFPPAHPPMCTLLGVSIILGDQTLGNLYLSEREDGEPFDTADLEVLQVLASHAAAAIDRVHIHHRVEAQRDHLRIILDSLPAGVLILSGPDGRIEMTNRALNEMLFGPGSLPDQPPESCHEIRILQADGMPLPLEQRLSVRALQGDIVNNQRLLLETAGGQHVPVLAQAVPLPNASGVDGAVIVFQDVTHLREAEQLKEDFLSLVSHEFRTPLTAIHGGAQLLLNQGAELSPSTRYELLCDIVDESDRLDRMLTNMLVLTDVMAGRLAASTEPLLLERVVRAAATAVAARTSRHTFVLDITPHLPPAEGDRELMMQVLINLYQNAVKYSPAGGKITTTVTADSRTMTIAIADQGIGMAEDEIARIFERFYRTRSDPSVRGTGLGLYLSHYLIQAQGGQIRASSPGPSHGTVLTITLPMAADWLDISGEERAAELGAR